MQRSPLEWQRSTEHWESTHPSEEGSARLKRSFPHGARPVSLRSFGQVVWTGRLDRSFGQVVPQGPKNILFEGARKTPEEDPRRRPQKKNMEKAGGAGFAAKLFGPPSRRSSGTAEVCASPPKSPLGPLAFSPVFPGAPLRKASAGLPFRSRSLPTAVHPKRAPRRPLRRVARGPVPPPRPRPQSRTAALR